MVERRRAASKAYADLTSGTDRHHDLERLAHALGIDPLAKRSSPALALAIATQA
jgi:hypothetical protein